MYKQKMEAINKVITKQMFNIKTIYISTRTFKLQWRVI